MRASPKHWRLVAASRRRTNGDASWGFSAGLIIGLVIGGSLGALMMAVLAVGKIDDIRRGRHDET
jgi:hypothetical protein